MRWLPSSPCRQRAVDPHLHKQRVASVGLCSSWGERTCCPAPCLGRGGPCKDSGVPSWPALRLGFSMALFLSVSRACSSTGHPGVRRCGDFSPSQCTHSAPRSLLQVLPHVLHVCQPGVCGANTAADAQLAAPVPLLPLVSWVGWGRTGTLQDTPGYADSSVLSAGPFPSWE